MCGRFSLAAPIEAVADQFGLAGDIPALLPRYNIAPGQRVAAVRALPGDSRRELVMLHWGLIPSWSTSRQHAMRMINARAETVATKPAFRSAYRKRHCLIPADGFYEWHHQGKEKQPYRMVATNGTVLGLAGLWEHWRDEAGRLEESCVILTTAANAVLADIHERMPLIIPPENYQRWLVPPGSSKEAGELLFPSESPKIRAYPVGMTVNNPKNDLPACFY